MKQIGQMMQIYRTENRGYSPPMVDGLLYYTYADVLTLMSESPWEIWMLLAGPGSGQYMPVQESGAFRDVDVPDFPWDNHATSYMVNPRVLALRIRKVSAAAFYMIRSYWAKTILVSPSPNLIDQAFCGINGRLVWAR